jgi:hypothetical protein
MTLGPALTAVFLPAGGLMNVAETLLGVPEPAVAT